MASRPGVAQIRGDKRRHELENPGHKRAGPGMDAWVCKTRGCRGATSRVITFAPGGERMSIEAKRTYQAPEIIEFGQMEELTKGSGLGIIDYFVFGNSDVIGNCSDNSCARS